MSSPAEILPGAEPMSIAGGSAGVLVLHGFTGNPQSMRGLAEAFAAAGFSVELPLLPGHGTALSDMLVTDWDDWSSAAESAYLDLSQRCESVVVAGLSMGGTLSLWLAARHPELAGIVLINPACPPPNSADGLVEGLQAMVDAGEVLMDAIGGDIADPDGHEIAYGQVPLKQLISLWQAAEDVSGTLSAIECPALLLTSPEDHVVPPEHGDHVVTALGGPVERVSLDRSYHVATLDYDKELIAERAVAFAQRVTTA